MLASFDLIIVEAGSGGGMWEEGQEAEQEAPAERIEMRRE